jgi:hypothetical protein
MVAITRTVPRAERAAVAATIVRLASGEPTITVRSARVLRRALRDERLIVAREGARVVGWFLAEPCGGQVQELGFLFVDRTVRNQGVLAEMLDLGLRLRPRSVAVTFRADLAQFLIREKGFRASTLAELIRVSHGWFLLRRLTLTRLAIALRRTSQKTAYFLLYPGRP